MKNKVLVILSVVVVVFLFGFFVLRFLYTEDDGTKEVENKYLICNAKDKDDYPLLADTEYDSANYEARMSYVNGKIYDINFIVSQHFSNEQSAKAFTDRIQAGYNIYTGNNKIQRANITSTFTSVDNIGKMVIAIRGNVFNKKMAPMIMLDGVDENINVDEAKEKYQKNGFSCSIDEKDMVLSD